MSGIAKFVGALVLAVVALVLVNRFYPGNHAAGIISAIGVFILSIGK